MFGFGGFLSHLNDVEKEKFFVLKIKYDSNTFMFEDVLLGSNLRH